LPEFCCLGQVEIHEGTIVYETAEGKAVAAAAMTNDEVLRICAEGRRLSIRNPQSSPSSFVIDSTIVIRHFQLAGLRPAVTA
jgi:hypothetical protein